MLESRKIRICIMPDGSEAVHTLYFPRWLPYLGGAVLTAVLTVLGVYSYQSYDALKIFGDNSVEMEALRFTNASQKAQLDIFVDRVSTLDRQITALKTQEMEVAALKEEVNRQMGLNPDASFIELLPRLSAAVSWANSPDGMGGSEQLANALSATAVSGRSRDVIRGMHRDLDRLQMKADDTGHYFASMKDNLIGAQSVLASTPMFLPVSGQLSAKFGSRLSPFNRVSREKHRGIDIPVPTGTVVKAPANGTVLSVGEAGGYGLMVTVDHGYGLITRYAHLSEALVEPGDTVARGQNMARTGNSGRSTGPHLHYETVLGGVAVDPLKLLPFDVAKNVTAKENAEPLD